MSEPATVIRPFASDGFVAHALHQGERNWGEANCYVDLWIEALHALGCDPHAMLSFTLGLDFEGDQWTFFKPPLADLEALYGVQVEELCVWHQLAGHVEQQVADGRLAIVEVDAWFLPDTRGTTYRAEHGKTAIAVNGIERGARRLGYFHNGGYFVLDGDDFDGVMQVAPAVGTLPPYVELVRLHALARRSPGELVELARRQVGAQLARRRPGNPVDAYAARFARDLDWLRAQPLASFHLWAFATVRQLGSAAELGARFLAWLGAHGEVGLAEPAAALDALAAAAKALQFKVVRTLSSKRPLDAAATFAELARAWDAAHRPLAARAWS